MTKKLIYVIDDIPEIGKMISEILEKEYEVEKFIDPLDCLKKTLNTRPPDIYLTDYKMPNIDGVEFIRKLLENGIKQPVIIVSGYTDKRLVIDALNRGVVGIIEKPFDPDKLLKKVATILKKIDSKKIENLLIQDLEDHLSLNLTGFTNIKKNQWY